MCRDLPNSYSLCFISFLRHNRKQPYRRSTLHIQQSLNDTLHATAIYFKDYRAFVRPSLSTSPEAVGYSTTAVQIMDSKPSLQREKNDTTATTFQIQSNSSQLESQEQSQPTSNMFQGPYQDDSTLAVYLNLRTIPARFLIWFNIAFSWLVGIAIATRSIDRVLDAYFPGFDKATVAITFVGVYIAHAILAHTLGVFYGMAYELWRNPYARAPTLRGKVGREEEAAMLKENRLRARRLCRFLLPWKA
jgi:hypothetical protein